MPPKTENTVPERRRHREAPKVPKLDATGFEPLWISCDTPCLTCGADSTLAALHDPTWRKCPVCEGAAP